MLQAQIFVNMDEQKGDLLLHDYILHFLLEHEIQGATVFRAVSGFGSNHQIKHPSALFSFDEPPGMITFVDEEPKVRRVIQALRNEGIQALITVHLVENIPG